VVNPQIPDLTILNLP